jgi:FkbM family methyltransferase|tara:strand:- start:4400 stop:5020 length:621 start_codon:yes stop_codon:yes gene_type:complete
MLLSFRLLKKKYKMNIKGIIHIGAHFGQEIPDYIDCGIQDMVMFEPLQENFKVLAEKAKDLNANIVGHQVALGPEPGKTKMYVSDHNRISSSILKPKVHLTHHPNVKFPETEEVEVNCLDNYDCFNYNFINMDVQGYELEVLKGGKKTLEQVDYVYCEVNRDEVYENNAFVEELDEFLAEYNMERVMTSWEGQIWGDALYVRKNLL